MEKLVLVDGNAILHRAFHALPPLTDKNGNIVNAVYGFFSMLLSVLREQQADYLAVCFDRPKPTFRQELFVGYQQHRPQMSDDLVPQVATLHQALEKMNVQLFEVDGYEADDLIGTIAFQAMSLESQISNVKSQISNKDRETKKSIDSLEILIVSGDRDLLQLVNSHVKMLAPVVGLKNIIVYNEAKVEEKFGVKPSQVVDYKALIGDPSDGYPGVSGIGPKTASALLQKYGTLENIYNNLGELAPKIAERLATDSEQAALAKKLATIVTDAPISFDIEKCSMTLFDAASAAVVFSDLGFKSLIARLPKANGRFEDNASVKPVQKKEKNNGQLNLL